MPGEASRAIITQSKVPIPRQLAEKETFESLKHWKTCFRSFYRRDSYFAFFLRSNTKWDSSKEYYGFTDSTEADGLKRTAIDLNDDLIAFLNIISGFLPYSYVKERFVQSTNCLEDVWNILDEIYDAQISSSSLLDFAGIKKQVPRVIVNSLRDCQITLDNISLDPIFKLMGCLLDKKEMS